jgi:ribonuclease P protein component
MNFHPFFVCALQQKSSALRALHPLNELPHARLGVVVAKRFAPRAVTRNTIKRVTRELFRQTGLPPSTAWCACPSRSIPRMDPATTAALKARCGRNWPRCSQIAKLAPSCRGAQP